MIRRSVTVGIAALLSVPAFAYAQETGSAKLEVQDRKPYGQYLVDGEGRALYILEKDPKGASTCYSACAEVWPPMISASKPHVGAKVNSSLLGTIKRKDGAMQVTYNGMPLYYYVKDKGAGSVTGQDVHDAWGEWYLISPSGKVIEDTKK